MGIIVQHLQADPVPPHELSPERRIPEALSAVVLRALEKDPAKRFASAEDMRRALEDWPAAWRAHLRIRAAHRPEQPDRPRRAGAPAIAGPPPAAAALIG
jgi:serine/threonine protein kinase